MNRRPSHRAAHALRFCNALSPVANGNRPPYDRFVAALVATGFDSPNGKRRTTASRRYFFVRMPSRAFNGRAMAGRAHALPVSVCAGLSTLPCARPPRLTVGSGIETAANGGQSMRLNPHAHSGQLQTQILSLIREALREAVSAPSDRASMDVTAAALVAVAAIVRKGVRA